MRLAPQPPRRKPKPKRNKLLLPKRRRKQNNPQLRLLRHNRLSSRLNKPGNRLS